MRRNQKCQGQMKENTCLGKRSHSLDGVWYTQWLSELPYQKVCTNKEQKVCDYKSPPISSQPFQRIINHTFRLPLTDYILFETSIHSLLHPLLYSPRGPGGSLTFKYRVSNSYRCRVVPAPS